jgi:hypothetical protein
VDGGQVDGRSGRYVNSRKPRFRGTSACVSYSPDIESLPESLRRLAALESPEPDLHAAMDRHRDLLSPLVGHALGTIGGGNHQLNFAAWPYTGGRAQMADAILPGGVRWSERPRGAEGSQAARYQLGWRLLRKWEGWECLPPRLAC